MMYMLGVVNFEPQSKDQTLAAFLRQALLRYRERYPKVGDRLVISMRPEFLSLLMLETPGLVQRQGAALLFEDCRLQTVSWAYGVTLYIHPEGADVLDLSAPLEVRHAD